mmetsp:Transcript_41607/g.114696  ORF Transcript_41607/g.114696 Transcript_41607/m.114696 type:complete len:220 (+) Transcript_41607:1207-1866(+)
MVPPQVLQRFKWITSTGGSFQRSIFFRASTCCPQPLHTHRSSPTNTSSSTKHRNASARFDMPWDTGSDKYRNGSKRRETWPQRMQDNEDLSCPCMRSTRKDFPRSRYRIQESAAANSSPRFDARRSSAKASSALDGGGGDTTRFKSSCRPSKQKVRNSWMSCCCRSLKRCGARPVSVRHKIRGFCEARSSCQSARCKSAKASANLPLQPRALSRLTSSQ